jgi:hypothetical protein
MSIGSIARTSPRWGAQRGLLFRETFVSPIPRKSHPGKRNFVPRDFSQNGRLIEPGDRPIAMGDWASVRQPTELSGLFKPAVVMPVRGDWLVVDAVAPNRSAEPRKQLVTAAFSERDLLLAAGEEKGKTAQEQGTYRGKTGGLQAGDNVHLTN